MQHAILSKSSINSIYLQLVHTHRIDNYRRDIDLKMSMWHIGAAGGIKGKGVNDINILLMYKFLKESMQNLN